ncbi:pectate lyase superfamily protein-domain-containing protein [Immersiella caudata]|uniref:Pectate lyase superfamily protein-domain-containing protein n=1 Tax=Immersiella caudata TaxID=314043 RepID=A0AA40BXZ0_9PEZI|nr:pectate lyase superfamily protein-domain-containing protein [Immersiella caudata]
MRHLTLLLGLAASLMAVETVATNHSAGYWYEAIQHNGINTETTNAKYLVFRNVKDFGAKADGITDDSAAIQKAINTVDGSTGTRNAAGSLTGSPAVVYFPAGTYLLKTGLKNIMGTILMGDPTNRPILKAAPDFRDRVVLAGHGTSAGGLVSFFYGIKNFVLDSTAVSPTKTIVLLENNVSQACQLSNVMVSMPVGATAHTGIVTAGQLMPLLMNDIQIVGGGVGYLATALQLHLKSWQFTNVQTGIKVSDTLTQATFQGLQFGGCTVAIDASSGGSGHLTVIDSSAVNTPTFLLAATTTTMQGSLVLENVIVDALTVKIGSTTALTGSVAPGTTWIRGSIYTNTTSSQTVSPSTTHRTSRPPILINTTTYSYHTVSPPTYADIPPSQILNVKSIPSLPVLGNGITDDTSNLQSIILSAAKNNQVLFFPHGVYILTDTLYVPPGSRIIGEAWTRITPRGSKFTDVKRPRAMIRVGNAGEIGTAQVSDFLMYVPSGSEKLPGLVMVEVNMAGTKPGDVGFFNTHFMMMGGTARLCVHLKETASVYWENSWATAQGNGVGGPGFAGGFLVEARGGTWMVGVGSEHHFLYQINIHYAQNVFLGLEQGESPYWQGAGNALLPPAPFTASLLPSDPDFTWCPATDAKCRMALYQYVTNSSGINLYGGAFWNFRAGPSQGLCSGDCQTNAVLYENNKEMYSYGIATINDRNMVLETGPRGSVKTVGAVRDANFGEPLPGFTIHRPAFVAGYLRQS